MQPDDFKITAKKILDICAKLIGTTSGYVVLQSEDDREEKHQAASNTCNNHADF